MECGVSHFSDSKTRPFVNWQTLKKEKINVFGMIICYVVGMLFYGELFHMLWRT